MVGIVLVSHSKELAEGVEHLLRMMAEHVPVVAAGGLPDGDYGTSFETISDAIVYADHGDGVLVIMDMGSAVMTAEMALEALDDVNAKLVDCPMVEGAVAASVAAEGGLSLEEVKAAAEDAWEARKL